MLVEKYRPKTIKEVVGHDSIKTVLSNFLTSEDVPHVLFHGQPGIGKTTLAHAFALEYYGGHFSSNFKEWNSSDARGIDVVRGEIKDFTRHAASGGFGFRIALLDEVDGLTQDAQRGLNRTLENAHRTCRFWATCNTPSKLIPALRSRFVRMYTRPLHTEEVTEHLIMINNKEEINIDQEILDYISHYVKGDLRQAVEILGIIPSECDIQILHSLFPQTTDEQLAVLVEETLTGSEPDIKHIVDHEATFESLYSLFLQRDHPLKPQILDAIAEYAYRATVGSPKMQLGTCLRRIQQVVGVS